MFFCIECYRGINAFKTKAPLLKGLGLSQPVILEPPAFTLTNQYYSYGGQLTFPLTSRPHVEKNGTLSGFGNSVKIGLFITSWAIAVTISAGFGDQLKDS